MRLLGYSRSSAWIVWSSAERACELLARGSGRGGGGGVMISTGRIGLKTAESSGLRIRDLGVGLVGVGLE